MQTLKLATIDTDPSLHPGAGVADASLNGEASARVLVVDSDRLVRETVTGVLQGMAATLPAPARGKRR